MMAMIENGVSTRARPLLAGHREPGSPPRRRVRLLRRAHDRSIPRRPSCPPRRPRPESVQFFSSAESAERAGFRTLPLPPPPCCCPAAPPRGACRRLARRARRETRHPVHAGRRTRNQPRPPPADLHLVGHRGLAPPVRGGPPAGGDQARRAQGAVRRRAPRAERAMARAAASTPRRGVVGMTPSAYKNGGACLAITYASGQSPVGACPRRGHRGAAHPARSVSARTIRRCWHPPAAEHSPPHHPAPTTRPAALLAGDLILAHLRNRAPLPALPLDVQRLAASVPRLAGAALEFPVGETRSYAEIANAIGNPKAVRAVAHACAANPVSLVIPCHRVLRADGALGGYRWGMNRKRALLEAERHSAQPKHFAG